MTPGDRWGIVTRYRDGFDREREVPQATVRALVEAMGGDPDGPPPPEPDVTVTSRDRLPDVDGVDDVVEVALEDGGRVDAPGRLPPDLPLGYHRLRRRGVDQEGRLIVSPGSCHLPADLRAWGLAAQVYALRSADNWGLGDLADLRRLGAWASSVGARTLLVNPVDAVAPQTPRETSPYMPSSRRFRDWLYLRVEEVPGAAAAAGEIAQARGRLVATPEVDRDAVAAAKRPALRAVFDARGADEPGFSAFVAEQGEALRTYAVWEALADREGGDWRDWPEPLRRPSAALLDRVEREIPDDVRFWMWLQWCADLQLADAGAAIPLLRDLPVGFAPGGMDAWQWQDLLADGVTIGAPPDELGPQGQNWSLPAFVPWKLRAAGYEPFLQTLRAGFRHAGGLRIDHVLGLFRLFWIPPDGDADAGAYVVQPTRDLLDVVALESVRAGAVVVGEDLGTVGAGVRDELERRRMLRYRVFWFEDDPPGDWGAQALASVSTHDLPTVAGAWTGADAAEQEELGLDPDEGWYAELKSLLQAAADGGDDLDEVLVAVHHRLARSDCAIVLAQLEDLLGVERRINVPGTDRGDRPANWSQPLPVTLDELERDDRVRRIVEAIAGAR